MSLFDRLRGKMAKESNAVYHLEGEAGQVLAALRSVNDPELNVNIVDLGLIRSVVADDAGFEVAMTLTTRGCPVGPVLVDEAAAADELGAELAHVHIALAIGLGLHLRAPHHPRS